MSRCDYCGNHGVRNNEYCSCPHGSAAKIRNGDYKMNPKLEAAIDRVIKQHDKALRRLAKS